MSEHDVRGEFRAFVHGASDVDLGVFDTEDAAVNAIGAAVGKPAECRNGYHVVRVGARWGDDSLGYIIDEAHVRRRRIERIAELRNLIPELQAELARLEAKADE